MRETNCYATNINHSQYFFGNAWFSAAVRSDYNQTSREHTIEEFSPCYVACISSWEENRRPECAFNEWKTFDNLVSPVPLKAGVAALFTSSNNVVAFLFYSFSYHQCFRHDGKLRPRFKSSCNTSIVKEKYSFCLIFCVYIF